MLNFGCDYLEGAHEKILARFIETNMEKEPGYGADKYTISAKKRILDACECPDGEVFLLVGGTQTNSTVIDAYLNNYQGVIAAPTGHIACHESGAIESCGHKVLTIPQHLGKIDAGELKEFLVNFYADETYEHQVIPGMVYISHPTEYGTLYTKAELEAIYTICKEYEMPLFVDGARLGYGLAADDTDVTLPDLAKLCDAFYIGGTKVGALCGEAVVFTKKAPKFFFTTVKQHGALLAKGRLVGIQFDTLFTDDLYMEISKHAIRLANILKAGVLAKGYKLLLDSPTNQQFIIVDNEKYAELKKQVAFSTWEKVDADHTAIRFATSWATKEEDVQALLELL
ncbi:MAG: low specificity L-threonine aldolase [Lachnospiraceae bacterium]|nr:low specificity L-threonine aldolase [Lachnospiraceae bacterium]MBQ5698808.1 low specificity L-threonine aldolase [Lachnospiraceae bacterium]